MPSRCKPPASLISRHPVSSLFYPPAFARTSSTASPFYPPIPAATTTTGPFQHAATQQQRGRSVAQRKVPSDAGLTLGEQDVVLRAERDKKKAEGHNTRRKNKFLRVACDPLPLSSSTLLLLSCATTKQNSKFCNDAISTHLHVVYDLQKSRSLGFIQFGGFGRDLGWSGSDGCPSCLLSDQTHNTHHHRQAGRQA